MGIAKTIAKWICAAVTILAVYLLVMGVILTVVVGPFGSGAGDDTTSDDDSRFMQICVEKNISLVTPAPTATPELVESSIADNINVIKSGQDIIVECKRLSVFGNNNAIHIANSDVDRIVITGYGNSISYSSGADPRIDDNGDYNDVWQRWLT